LTGFWAAKVSALFVNLKQSTGIISFKAWTVKVCLEVTIDETMITHLYAAASGYARLVWCEFTNE
jgi:hypothetical protein